MHSHRTRAPEPVTAGRNEGLVPLDDDDMLMVGLPRPAGKSMLAARL